MIEGIKAPKAIRQGKRTSKSRYSLEAFWFKRGGRRTEAKLFHIAELADLEKAIEPYLRRISIALYLDRDDGETGSVWAHVTRDRAWVTHMTCPGGIDTIAFDRARKNSSEGIIGFRLNNGQVDPVHPFWTISRVDAIRALEYFVVYGERDPRLQWGTPKISFEQPLLAGK